MQLSKNFSLAELTKSEIGLRKNIKNMPTDKDIQNLTVLAQTILQPIRDHIGQPLIVNSAYRSLLVNSAVGGSKSSQHMKGEAADIRVPNMEVNKLMEIIIGLDLPYHQLINEFDSWVHVSIAPNGGKPKKQVLHFKRK